MSKILQHSLKFRIANVAASSSRSIQTEVCIGTSRAPPKLLSHIFAPISSLTILGFSRDSNLHGNKSRAEIVGFSFVKKCKYFILFYK